VDLVAPRIAFARVIGDLDLQQQEVPGAPQDRARRSGAVLGALRGHDDFLELRARWRAPPRQHAGRQPAGVPEPQPSPPPHFFHDEILLCLWPRDPSALR
jgi:hypothetical protein